MHNIFTLLLNTKSSLIRAYVLKIFSRFKSKSKLDPAWYFIHWGRSENAHPNKRWPFESYGMQLPWKTRFKCSTISNKWFDSLSSCNQRVVPDVTHSPLSFRRLFRRHSLWITLASTGVCVWDTKNRQNPVYIICNIIRFLVRHYNWIICNPRWSVELDTVPVSIFLKLCHRP